MWLATRAQNLPAVAPLAELGHGAAEFHTILRNSLGAIPRISNKRVALGSVPVRELGGHDETQLARRDASVYIVARPAPDLSGLLPGGGDQQLRPQQRARIMPNGDDAVGSADVRRAELSPQRHGQRRWRMGLVGTVVTATDLFASGGVSGSGQRPDMPIGSFHHKPRRRDCGTDS